MRQPPKRYFAKLYLTTCSVCLLVLLALAFSTYTQMKQTLYENELQKSQLLFSHIKGSAQSIFAGLETTAYTICESPETKQLMYATGRETGALVTDINRVSKNISFNPAVHSVYIYNKLEDTYYSTRNGLYDVDADFAAVSAGHYADADFPLTRKAGDIWVLTYRLVDTYYSDQKQNAVYVNFDYNWIFDSILNATSVLGDSLLVFTGDMQRIDAGAQSDSRALVLPPEVLEQLAQAPYDSYGVTAFTCDGEAQHVNYIKLSRPDWILFKTTPLSQLNQGIAQWRNTVCISLFFALLFAVVCYIFISKTLYSPIRRMVTLLPQMSKTERADEFTLFEKYLSTQKNELDRLLESRQASEQHRQESAVSTLVCGHYTVNEQFTKTLRSIYSFQTNFSRPYRMCVASFDDIENIFMLFCAETEKGIALYAIRNIMLECFSATFSCDYAYTENDCIVLLLNETEDKTALTACIRLAQTSLREVFHTTISFAVSPPLHAISDAPAAYRHLSALLEEKFFTGRGSIFTSDTKLSGARPLSAYNNRYEGKILDLIEQKRYHELATKGQQYVDGFVGELTSLNYTAAHMALMLFADALQKLFWENNDSQTDPIEIERITQMLSASEIHFLSDIPTVLTNVVTLLGEKKNSIGQAQLEFVEKSIAYIAAHFSDYALCATTLAEFIGVSSPYLGKIFKQQTGKSIPEHINEVRLEKAAQWLKSPDCSIQDISARAGYQNATYFFKVFKARYGLTPKAYQEKYRRRG